MMFRFSRYHVMPWIVGSLLLCLGVLVLPCHGQRFLSLASEDPRWHWESADSAINAARFDVDVALRLHGEQSTEAAYAFIRLSELLQFRCDTCRVECIEAANQAYQIAVSDSVQCDSLLMIAAFTWDAARERYNPWSDRYTEIRSALDTCFACDWCDSLKMGRILQRVTSSHFHGGNFDIGRSYLRRALGILERNDMPDSLNVLACVWALRSATDYPESQSLLKRAEALSNHAARYGTKVYPTPGVIARTKGEQFLRTGDLVEALPLLNQSVELASLEFPSTSCQVARSHVSLAHCLVELGCADEAISHFRVAIETWRSCGEAVPPYFLVSAMTDLGELYLEEGQLSNAEEHLIEALQIAREQSLAEWQDVYARLLAALSRTYHVTGRLELATNYGWTALELASTVHSPSDAAVAIFQENLAALLFEQDQTHAAMALQTTALDLCEGAYGPYHPATTEGLERLAWMQTQYVVEADTFLRAWRDSQSQAVRSIEAAYRSRFDWLRSAAETLPEFELIQSADAFRRTAGQYLDIVIESDDTANVNRAATIIYDGKALLWHALADRYAKHDEFVNTASDTLAKLRREIQTCIVLAAKEPSDSLKKRLEYLWHKRVHWEREYDSEEQSRSTNGAYPTTTIQDVRAALPDSAIAIDILRYERPVTWMQWQSCYALLCNSRASAKLVNLGPCAPIDSLVQDLVAQCNTPSDLDESSYQAISAELYNKLFGEIFRDIETANMLFVSADGMLHNLACGTLVDRNHDYLIEHVAVQYLNTSRDLLYRNDDNQATGTGWLIVADPDFDATEQPRTDSLVFATDQISLRAAVAPAWSEHWSRLPAAINEVTTALALADTCRTEVLTGKGANYTNVVRALPGKRVAYFATHGYSVLDPAKDLQLSVDMLYLEEFLKRDPMISSGLVLAGANQISDRANSNAYLTAADITGLNLQGVDISFLSACETGIGRIVAGEGVYALRRAFELAGSKATVSALWRIDDNSTSTLLGRLKEHARLPIGVALSLAERDEILSRRSAGLSTHPFFWGGFVTSGQWRTAITQ